MPGCRVAPRPCGESPQADPPTPEEDKNREVVQDFLRRVWYYRWTAADDEKFLAEREKGNMSYVPPSISDALDELRSPDTVRHRRDLDGRPIRSSGPDDYKMCVNAVRALAQDLNVTILDIIANGDRVIAHMVLEGVDRRVDASADADGAFGVRSPTGKRFRTQTAALYRVHEGRIAEDWLLYGGDLTYSAPSHPY